MADRIRGLDASSVQGKLDFARIKTSGLELGFVILKLWEGNQTSQDPSFEANAKAALAANVEPFAYVFGYPLIEDGVNANRGPEDQARLWVEAVSKYPELAKRPLFVDLEWPPPNEWAPASKKWGCTAATVNEWCKRACAEVERLMAGPEGVGPKPVIYTYPYWWRALVEAGCDVSWAREYPLWIASYNTACKWPLPAQQPIAVEPWGVNGWLFWQFDGDKGLRLPDGRDCDFCIFNGDRAALNEFAGWSPSRV